MELIFLAIGFLLFWTTILFTHHLFVSCLVHPYLNLVKFIGLRVKPFYLGIYWNRFHNGLTRISNNQGDFVKIWMNLGVFSSLFLTPVSICILLQTIVNLLSLETDQSNNFGSLEPFLPGVNLPLGEIFYYVIALLVSSVFHEFGHFIAAIKEGIKVNGVGLSLFGILPIAFVDISEEQLKKLAIGGKLRIFCAGVWHNLTLGLLAATLLLVNPTILSPLYKTDEGVVILNIRDNWEAIGDNAIQSNDIITAINRNCYIRDKNDWKSCFLDLLNDPEDCYCISDGFIAFESVQPMGIACCNDNLKRHLCFNRIQSSQEYCLPARKLLEEYKNVCNETARCPLGHTCVRPKSENPGFKLVELQRKDKSAFLFWGHPYEVYTALTVTNYQPRFDWLPLSPIQKWETLLRYITSFSLALALLNSVPCFVMDGKYIASSTLDLLFGRLFTRKSLALVQSYLTIFGTFLIVVCVTLGFISIILRHKIAFI